MAQSADVRDPSGTAVHELSATVAGFTVIDRSGERIGSVRDVSLDRTCLLVEARRSLLGRKQTHAAHVWAVREIDSEARTISLAASHAEVASAPEYHQLDKESETAIARYYYARLTGFSDPQRDRTPSPRR